MGSLLRKCKKENDFIAEDVIYFIIPKGDLENIHINNTCFKRMS
jgi:hypothetical protein